MRYGRPRPKAPGLPEQPTPMPTTNPVRDSRSIGLPSVVPILKGCHSIGSCGNGEGCCRKPICCLFCNRYNGALHRLYPDIEMNDEVDYKNNPLHGVSLKKLLTEMVNHYGFDILFAYLNINCFKTNPSIDSSVKFLKKTDWAREKVEAFYLYQFKNLPRASAKQFALPPRDRIIPTDQSPGEPAELTLEDGNRLREKRAKQAAERDARPRPPSNKARGKPQGVQNRNAQRKQGVGKDDRQGSHPSSIAADTGSDPWAKWKK